jgi:hypothetical protein
MEKEACTSRKEGSVEELGMISERKNWVHMKMGCIWVEMAHTGKEVCMCGGSGVYRQGGSSFLLN